MSLGNSLHERQLLLLLSLLIIPILKAEDPSLFLVWKVTSITASPLGVPQKVIAINGQFPGPVLHATTNWNLVINVFNRLEEPFLMTWNGVQQRHNSWQDGVPGTNCPIPPGSNWTYRFQVKDQIGSFFYSPSALFQRAGGGFGSIRLDNRAPIPVPFAPPADDVSLLIGDWYHTSYSLLRAALDAGRPLRKPDGILINGKGSPGDGGYTTIKVTPGSTVRLRIANVGTSTSLNFRIEGHQLLMVEAEGSYTKQVLYDHLDIHVGQSYSVLVTANQNPRDYSIVASSRFVDPVLTGVAVLHYTNSQQSASGPLPTGPKPLDIQSSLKQARSIRWNLKAGAARPNPQGSFHYGRIKVAKTFVFANSAPVINGRQRYAVNDVSFMVPDTPIKLADFYRLDGVFDLNGIPEFPSGKKPTVGTPVLSGDYRAFVEIIFQNNETDIQSWHIDGYACFVVGFNFGSWSPAARQSYNLKNAVARSTTQVYPSAWTAVLVELDNVGLWNVRSQMLHRQYLGQEFYLKVYDPSNSVSSEYAPPDNMLRCGAAKKHK